MKLEEFKKLNEGKKKRSKLHLFAHEILELKHEGYTLQLILDFLAKNNIKSSKPNLFHFICRVEKESKTKTDVSKVKEEVKKDTEPKVKADTRTKTKEDPKVTDDDEKAKIEEYFKRIGHGKKNREETKESEEEKLFRLYGYRKK